MNPQDPQDGNIPPGSIQEYPYSYQGLDPATLLMYQQMMQDNDIYNYLYKIIDLHAPESFKKQLWVIIENTRFIATSNIREKDVLLYKRRISEQIDQVMESVPPTELNYSFYVILEIIELYLHLAIDRAVGGFERRMQTTQIKHLVMSQEADSFAAAQQPKKGIFRAFTKIFG